MYVMFKRIYIQQWELFGSADQTIFQKGLIVRHAVNFYALM